MTQSVSSRRPKVVWSVKRSLTRRRPNARDATFLSCKHRVLPSRAVDKPRPRLSLAPKPPRSRERPLWSRHVSRRKPARSKRWVIAFLFPRLLHLCVVKALLDEYLGIWFFCCWLLCASIFNYSFRFVWFCTFLCRLSSLFTFYLNRCLPSVPLSPGIRAGATDARSWGWAQVHSWTKRAGGEERSGGGQHRDEEIPADGGSDRRQHHPSHCHVRPRDAGQASAVTRSQEHAHHRRQLAHQLVQHRSGPHRRCSPCSRELLIRHLSSSLCFSSGAFSCLVLLFDLRSLIIPLLLLYRIIF